MVCFVAFLRGINVGGRSVKKQVLQQAFTELGFTAVVTYKQSGNVIFSAKNGDEAALVSIIEEKLKATLGFEVPTFLRTLSELNAIAAAGPFKRQSVEGSSFLVTFLKNFVVFPVKLPVTIPKSKAQVIAVSGREVYSITYGGGEGALPNPYIEKALKTKATTRNLNIIKEIAEKYR